MDNVVYKVDNLNIITINRDKMTNLKEKQREITETLNILNSIYPDAQCSLNYTNPFELLVATIMSAQTTDIRVNKVTVKLFCHYRTVEQYASANVDDIAEKIRTVGCFRNKARNIVRAAQMVVCEFNSQVPQTLDELVRLPGVGRKTANVVLSNVFDLPGLAVDTHVKRVAYRLGWTDYSDPAKIEEQLCQLIPAKMWGHSSHLLIYHGRALCKARMPQCENCPISNRCCQRR